MGLFSSESCPICGEGVSGLFKIKIKDGRALCKSCGSQVCMESSMLPFQTLQDMKEHLHYRQINSQLFHNMQITQEIRAFTYFLRCDMEHQLWYFTTEKNPSNPPIFSFSEIINYEYVENGNAYSRSSYGLMGGVKTMPVTRSMQVRITLNNQYINQIVINLIMPGSEIKGTGMVYQGNRNMGERIMALLEVMMQKAEQIDTKPQNMPESNVSISVADEIKKFKELLDIGAISQEEFEIKKKQLLSL